ncbi:MAG: hypothetical protein KAS32_17445 [Candidatus Peribacteraceae bacterium]|nr:hypothetical protein [Candidatus Peribacteraceae bacterium]
MRKLNLKDYMVKVKVPDQMNPGQVIEGEYPYRFKDSVLALLFSPELHLSGADLVKQNVLAMKLEQCKDDEILLEEDEFQRITMAVEAHKGFNRNDVELVTRINEAEVVEVETKQT